MADNISGTVFKRTIETGCREEKPCPAQVMCPNLRCRKILSVPDDARGKVVKCQSCQSLLRVPDSKPSAPAATTSSMKK
ncbi:MAG: hypothetical protein KatS3mg104_1448 [Phycisphaerae bacterium]|nr:MAG: hypothetical protein KatS3mg104_1448 [Phycisphaerae bacterium]